MLHCQSITCSVSIAPKVAMAASVSSHCIAVPCVQLCGSAMRKRIDHAVKKSMKSRFFCGVFSGASFCVENAQLQMNSHARACWTCFLCCSLDSEGHSRGVLCAPCMCHTCTNLSVLGHSQACCIRHAHVTNKCLDPFPYSCQIITIKKTPLQFLQNFTG